MDTSVIIAAAGNSSRMGENKQKMLIGGVPVLARTMLAFESCKSVMEIIISTQKGEEEFVKELAERYNVTKFKTAVAGGKSRQESVLSGLDNISKESRMIAVHDGARPFVSPELIEKAIADARIFGGAALGVPVKDTIKTVHDGLITDTPPRQYLYAIQTPQVFKRKLYFEAAAFAKAHELDFTDDCQLVEAMGAKIAVTTGDYKNIKITTPEDIKIAEAFIKGE